MTLAETSHEQTSKIPLSNEQEIKENNAIIYLCQNLYVWFK